MDFDIVLKIATFFVGLVGTWKLITELLRSRQGALREEYKFAKDFLADLKNQEKMHPFLKEKGYQAIAGSSDLRVRRSNIY